jgi:RadC-like JAB domain
VIVHNQPSGAIKPPDTDLRITKRVASAAQILEINFIDHVTSLGLTPKLKLFWKGTLMRLAIGFWTHRR